MPDGRKTETTQQQESGHQEAQHRLKKLEQVDSNSSNYGKKMRQKIAERKKEFIVQK